MKNIYKISFVLLSFFAFIGCNVDDDDQEMVLPTKSISASFEKQVQIIAIPDNASSYDLVINFSEELPSYSSVEYSIDGGASATVSASTGDSSVTIPITFALTDNFHDVDISDFIVVNSQARNFTSSIVGNTTVRVMRQGYFTATMTWATPENDIDFGLQPMSSAWVDTYAWIDTSLGITNLEFLEGTLDDGNYAIAAAFYTSPTDVIVNYSLQTASGDYSFDLLTSEDFANVLWFTKSSDTDGTVSYTFYTEDPS
jgi:hypothetical protein